MPENTTGAVRLPIKLILPKQGIERKVPGGGAPKVPLRPINAEFRSRLSNQVTAIRKAILPQMAKTGAAPVRVKLVQKALAKSHRPQELEMRSDSCFIDTIEPNVKRTLHRYHREVIYGKDVRHELYVLDGISPDEMIQRLVNGYKCQQQESTL